MIHGPGAAAGTAVARTRAESLSASLAGDRLDELWLGRADRFRARVSGGRRAAGAIVSAGLVLAAAVVWWSSIPAIDPSRISDIGLITALPPLYFLAPILLAAGFALAVNNERSPGALLAIHVVLLVFMLHGVTSLIQEVPRFATTYVHTGLTDAIMRSGDLFEQRDARFSWPIFFALAAFLTSIAGLESALPLTSWIPTISNLLYLVPLFMIFSAFTVDRRAVWVGLWVFVLGNWVGQDYFSPQGFNILLYLTIIAVLVTWFRTGRPAPLARFAVKIRRRIGSPHADGPQPVDRVPLPATQPMARTGLVLILVLMTMIVVSSHQLTPFAVVAGTGILVVSRTTVIRGFPVLAAVLLGTWLSYMTLAFLAGHINGLLSEALQAEAVATTVADRLRGNPGHTFVVYERVAFSVVFWGLALLGGLRRLWNGHWDLPVALLAGYPFGFLALQSYGGEMSLRVFLFSWPFMCFFVAGLFYPRVRSVSALQPLFLVAVSSALIFGFFVARFGNDRADAITADEVQAVDRANAYMPPGSVVVTGNHNSPLGYKDYQLFDMSVAVPFRTSDAEAIARAIRRAAGDRRAFVFMSESQRSFFDLRGFPGEDWDLLLAQMEASPNFRAVFRTSDTTLLELIPDTAGSRQ